MTLPTQIFARWVLSFQVRDEVLYSHYQLILFIYAIVADVSLNVLELIDVEVFWADSQVGTFIDKCLKRFKTTYENPLPDVKLTVVY